MVDGALGLSATAVCFVSVGILCVFDFFWVEHGFTLIANGSITVKAIVQSKMMYKKLVFKQGCTDIRGITNFSDKCWGKITHDYVYSVHHLLKKLKQQLFLEALQILKDMTSGHNRDESATSSKTQVKEVSWGHCALLVDITWIQKYYCIF